MTAACEIGMVLDTLRNPGGEVCVLDMAMAESLCTRPAKMNTSLSTVFSSGVKHLVCVINTDRRQGSGTHWRVCVLTRSVAVANQWQLSLVDPAGSRAGSGFHNWYKTLWANLHCMGQALITGYTFVQGWEQGANNTLCGEVCVATIADFIQTGALTSRDPNNALIPSSNLTDAIGWLADARAQIAARMSTVQERDAGDDDHIDLTSDTE